MTVDVVEIGERQAKIGEVLKVKPLAVLAMIDEGELDWKVVAISVDDSKADLVNNVADVEKHFPVSLLSFKVILFNDLHILEESELNYFCSRLIFVMNRLQRKMQYAPTSSNQNFSVVLVFDGSGVRSQQIMRSWVFRQWHV